jgi:hypothetical protein
MGLLMNLTKPDDNEKIKRWMEMLDHNYAFGAFLAQIYDLGYEEGKKQAEGRVRQFHISGCVSRKSVMDELIVEGQASKRYGVGETWELNKQEIQEAIDRVPSIDFTIMEGR